MVYSLQLLPDMPRSKAGEGPTRLLATSKNLLKAGSQTISLLPESQSMAGLALKHYTTLTLQYNSSTKVSSWQQFRQVANTWFGMLLCYATNCDFHGTFTRLTVTFCEQRCLSVQGSG